MKIDTVILDNKEYYIIEKLKINSEEYYILVNVLDKEDLIIRKLLIEDNEEYLIGLNDEEEFNLVMKNYNEKVKK